MSVPIHLFGWLRWHARFIVFVFNVFLHVLHQLFHVLHVELVFTGKKGDQLLEGSIEIIAHEVLQEKALVFVLSHFGKVLMRFSECLIANKPFRHQYPNDG